jgi:hypothetical protein
MKQLVKKLSNILHVIFHYLFECHHSDLSRVFTIKHRTYQVCLECGRELDYSLSLMHIAPSQTPRDACDSADARCAAWSVQGVPLHNSGSYGSRGAA